MQSNASLIYVPVPAIGVDPGFNIRQDTAERVAHIDQLKESIRTVGLQVPLRVRHNNLHYVIVDGHCRFAALQALHQEGAHADPVRCFVEPGDSTPADHILTMLISDTRLPFQPLERAEGVLRLLRLGWNKTRVAGHLGCSVRQIEYLIDLAHVPEEVKAMVVEGEVAPTAAVKAVRKEGPTRAAEALTAAKDAKKEKKVKGGTAAKTPQAARRERASDHAPAAPRRPEDGPPPFDRETFHAMHETLRDLLRLTSVDLIHATIRDLYESLS